MGKTPQTIARGTTPEETLALMGIELPAAAPKPIANFANTAHDGGLLFVSGQGPLTADGTFLTGKVGADVTAEEAYDHARLVGINLVTVLRDELGALSRVRKVLKLFGMVNATPDFTRHPQVINGCSDLLEALFGHLGGHARSAIGVGSLPMGITVEIEAVVAVDEAG